MSAEGSSQIFALLPRASFVDAHASTRDADPGSDELRAIKRYWRPIAGCQGT
jgi:hypothetical protein